MTRYRGRMLQVQGGRCLFYRPRGRMWAWLPVREVKMEPGGWERGPEAVVSIVLSDWWARRVRWCRAQPGKAAPPVQTGKPKPPQAGKPAATEISPE